MDSIFQIDLPELAGSYLGGIMDEVRFSTVIAKAPQWVIRFAQNEHDTVDVISNPDLSA
jgi:hypothetical protein